MIAKLIVEGKEFPIEILDPELQELIKPKQTGYEKTTEYWTDVSGSGCGSKSVAIGASFEQALYDAANYYSDKTVCTNNARADKLMRNLRRFAVEHRKEAIDYNEGVYQIVYDYDEKKLTTNETIWFKPFGDIPFDTEETAQLAIDTFCDELMWYFTEYKDSL
jgi:hypothetical protein